MLLRECKLVEPILSGTCRYVSEFKITSPSASSLPFERFRYNYLNLVRVLVVALFITAKHWKQQAYPQGLVENHGGVSGIDSKRCG